MREPEERYNSDGEKLLLYEGIWMPETAVSAIRKRETYFACRKRPRIITPGFLLGIAVPVLGNLSVAAILKKAYSEIDIFKVFGALMAAYVFIRFKSVLIFIIKLYQRFASDNARKLCLFIPTCSEYAILAVEKYGAFAGTIKAVRRLLKCREPNGGEDWP